MTHVTHAHRRRVRHINKSFLDFSSRLNQTNAYLTPQHTLYKLTAARKAQNSAHSGHTTPLRAGTTPEPFSHQIIKFPPNFYAPTRSLHTIRSISNAKPASNARRGPRRRLAIARSLEPPAQSPAGNLRDQCPFFGPADSPAQTEMDPTPIPPDGARGRCRPHDHPRTI